MKPLPSNRSFGFLFFVVFISLAGFSYQSNKSLYVTYAWLCSGALIFIITALFPQKLTPFNKGWAYLGILLSEIVSPLSLGIIFFCLITPIGILTRFFGRDQLNVKVSHQVTYWINRNPPGPSGDSFKYQF
jgi:hypothetical protein